MEGMAGSSRAGGVYGMFGGAAADMSQTSTYGAAKDDADAPEQNMGTGTTDLSDWTIDEPVSERALDLVFIMDATGSMGSYIASATKNIETICDNIIRSEHLSGPGALRIGLLAYRDHPPQDHTYIVKNFGFTPEVTEVKANLKTLYASGGGDGPEAVTAALHALTQMEWRQRATRMAVLIADAPPHGIGEYGDGFPSGSPDGNDPLRIARQMSAAGIPLFVVACEPALSGYTYAADFFQALVRITGAQLLPLTSASLLAHVIIGAAGEAMDLDRLHRELGDSVAERMKAMSLEGASSGDAIMDEVTRELHQSLRLRNENTKQLYIENIYRESEASVHNINVWTTAPDLGTARPLLKRVVGSRLSDKYLSTRAAASSYRSYGDFPHPRSTSTSVVATDIYAASHPASSSASPPMIPLSFSPGSPERNAGATASGTLSLSPPSSRKVISDFSTFTATPGMSFSNAGGSPRLGEGMANGSTSTFSSPRAGMAEFGRGRERNAIGGGGFGGNHNSAANDGFDDDDDDDDDSFGEKKPSKPLPIEVNEDGTVEVRGEDGQKLAFRQGAISMEQVRRLAMQSAYRSGLAI